MPKISLSAENKVQDKGDYPKLSLDHGERALILCVEKEPTVEYKHVLRAPEIGPDGKVLKEIRKNNKGEEYEATVTEFMGQHLCFGDFATVQAKGVDPENCPTCRAAEEEEGITPPTEHYAMHVIQYSLQPGGWTLRDPFNVDLKAWVFSGTRLNQIIEIAEEFGDLHKHDLKLGPCENKKFQKYSINAASSAQWLVGSDEEVAIRKSVVAQTYENNQCPDLSQLIARRISKGDALGDVAKVVDRMNQVNNRAATTTVPDLSALKQNKPEATASSDESPFAVDTTTGEVTDKPNLKQMDFSDIMKDL